MNEFITFLVAVVVIAGLNIYLSRNVYPVEYEKASTLCTDGNTKVSRINVSGLNVSVYCKNGASFTFDAQTTAPKE